jgi:hypothetical protein
MAKTFGVLLIVGGVLGLVYGGFSYATATHSADLGVIVLQVQERHTVDVPIILSAGAIALGAFLLLAFKSR